MSGLARPLFLHAFADAANGLKNCSTIATPFASDHLNIRLACKRESARQSGSVHDRHPGRGQLDTDLRIKRQWGSDIRAMTNNSLLSPSTATRYSMWLPR